MKINLPTGGSVFLPGATPEQAAEHQLILDTRYRFAQSYAKLKGWPSNLDQLTITQIMEIRQQPGWAAANHTEVPLIATLTLSPEPDGKLVS